MEGSGLPTSEIVPASLKVSSEGLSLEGGYTCRLLFALLLLEIGSLSAVARARILEE